MPIPGAVPGSMGKRLLAHVIDQVALLVLGGGFLVAGLLPLATPGGEATPGPLLGVGAAMVLLLGVFQWWYQGSRGYTLGKRAVGLRTLGADSGRPVGLGRALVRLLVVAAGSLAFGVGQLVVLASPLLDSSGRRQGWHDKAAGTMVFDVGIGLDPMTASPGVGAPEVARRLDSLLGSAASTREVWPPAPTLPTGGRGPAPAPPTTWGPPAPEPEPAPEPPAPEPPAPRRPYFATVAAQAAAAAAAREAEARTDDEHAVDGPARADLPADRPVRADAPVDHPHPERGTAAGSPPTVAPRVEPIEPVTTVVPAPGVIHAVPQAPSAAVVPPPADLPPDVEATRLRPARGKVPEAAAPQGPLTAMVELTDGRRLHLAGTALVGRNPAPRPGEEVDQLVAVPDPGRSVSKTHLSIGVDEHGVWVRDRNSTNGTVVTLVDGQQILCAAEQQVRIPVGASVSFGDYGIVVLDAPSGRRAAR